MCVLSIGLTASNQSVFQSLLSLRELFIKFSPGIARSSIRPGKTSVQCSGAPDDEDQTRILEFYFDFAQCRDSHEMLLEKASTEKLFRRIFWAKNRRAFQRENETYALQSILHFTYVVISLKTLRRRAFAQNCIVWTASEKYKLANNAEQKPRILIFGRCYVRCENNAFLQFLQVVSCFFD